VYVKDNTLKIRNIKQTEDSTFVSLWDVNNAMKAVGLTVLKGFPYIQNWNNDKGFYFQAQQKLLYYSITTKSIDKQIPIDSAAENIQIDFEHQQIAYTVDNNLFVVKENQKPVQVNKEMPEEVRFGHIVHRNEFGIDQGTFWSPKGNYLAFYRMDESMVADYPLVNISTRIASLENEKYPMAGETSHECYRRRL
jgi:hypothetical protein